MDYELQQAELSKRFDEHVAPYVLDFFSADDKIAFNEEFSIWIDNLERCNEISMEVANNVCYVGKYS